jgi:hypothetical protein
MEGGVTILRPIRGNDNPFVRYVGALGGFESAAEAVEWQRDMRDED